MNKAIAVVACFYCSWVLAGSSSVKLKVSPGQQQPVTLSRLHLNRIVTPFPAPQIRTIDQADIRIEGSVIYLSSQQEEPFVVYITPHDSEVVPEGYELGTIPITDYQPCEQDGLTFDFAKGQQVQGHHFLVLIGTARNQSEKPVTFHEYHCQGSHTVAVAMWPKNTLYPGQRRELFILSTQAEPDSAPVVRPSLLTY